MSPREVLIKWVNLFNKQDADGLAELYHEHAINHQVALDPIEGRETIRQMFIDDFASANMTCIIQNIFQDGEWAMLEWKDPLGLRGCGFFHIVDSKIKFQRGYWDRLSFLREQGLPIPD